MCYLEPVKSERAAPFERRTSREILNGNLIFERARARLSQAALAEAAGVTRQTISEIERGVANPTLDVIERIANALGVGADRLFVYRRPGLVDDVELARRRAEAPEESVDAWDALAAIEEAAGRDPARYSRAGRPRLAP
jgi:putative transcriptional regulator